MVLDGTGSKQGSLGRLRHAMKGFHIEVATGISPAGEGP